MRTISLLMLVISTVYGNWHTIGGNNSRNGSVNVLGPEKAKILWSYKSNKSDCGWPIYIYKNRLVTSRTPWNQLIVNFEGGIVCHDLKTGELLWQKDTIITRSDRFLLFPVAFHNGIVYATNYTGGTDAVPIYALDGKNGDLLWESTFTIYGSGYRSLSFTENGDFLTMLWPKKRLARVNGTTGEILWDIPVSDYHPYFESFPIYNKTAYIWEAVDRIWNICAIDVETGERKYSIGLKGLKDNFVYATSWPVVGPDGTIYALRPYNALHAVKDHGDRLSELWSTKIDDGIRTPPAIGHDNSVYYTSLTTLFRANGKTGTILDSTAIHIPFKGQGQFAIDKKQRIYFNNADASDNGRLYCFTKDLKLQWVDTVRSIHMGGPALASNGMLAIAGDSTNVTVYFTGEDNINTENNQSVKKGPITILKGKIVLALEKPQTVTLTIYTIMGQKVYQNRTKQYTSGNHVFTPKGLTKGFYCYRLSFGTKHVEGKFLW